MKKTTDGDIERIDLDQTNTLPKLITQIQPRQSNLRCIKKPEVQQHSLRPLYRTRPDVGAIERLSVLLFIITIHHPERRVTIRRPHFGLYSSRNRHDVSIYRYSLTYRSEFRLALIVGGK